MTIGVYIYTNVHTNMVYRTYIY